MYGTDRDIKASGALRRGSGVTLGGLDSWIPGHQPVLEDVVVGLEEDDGGRLSDVSDEGVGLLHVDGEAVDQEALHKYFSKVKWYFEWRQSGLA